LRRKAEDLSRQIDVHGQKMLTEADQQYAAGEYPAALKSYRRILALFSGLPSAKQAAEKLAAARKDPELLAAVREDKASELFEPVDVMIQEARKKLAKAKPAKPSEAGQPAGTAAKAPAPTDEAVVATMPPKAQAKVVDNLRIIVKLYHDTPTGQKAAPLLKQLGANKSVMAAVQKWRNVERVRQLLSAARMYAAARMYEKAAGYYQQLLDKHPDSQFAPAARKELAEMKAKLLSSARPR
jgi:tetratricopeptide (TPR) repeat protein